MYKLIKNIPFVRGFTYATPPYHIGSVTENRIGLQLFRTTSKYALWKLRGRQMSEEIKSHIRTLERDGVLVIEDFLPQNQFEDIRREFEKANENIDLAPYKGDRNSKLFRTQLSVAESPEKFTSIIKHFQKNEMLKKIASAVIRRKIEKDPDIRLDTYQNLNEAGFDNDIENILHADLHTSTVKMFFYLNEVNETNGAFIYAKGSHKLTIERLKYEYELSIRQAKMKKGLKIQDALLSRRGKEVRNIIAPTQLSNMGVAETQVCVKPNTLVIANNMGFHRRGEFSCGTPRKALLINFRNSEKPVW